MSAFTDERANACFRFGSMVNAQPCTMGEIIDYGVGIGVATKSPPRSQAIQNVQEEIRQRWDVREERNTEMEYLAKGGNPLDFEFYHVPTASGPSTSVTNQLAEQNFISEANGCFAASPHGDSLESNDRPGSSLCHETNTVDGGGESGIVENKIVKRGTKRLNAAKLKQSLSTGSNRSARKTEDSGLSCLVVKDQAYVRRNRSKPSRESTNVSSIRSPVTPAKGSEPRDEKGAALRKKAYKHVSSVKSTASDDQVTMEVDGFQNVREDDCVVNNSKVEVLASLEIPGANSKVFERPCDSSASTSDERESSAGDEKADDSHLDVDHIHEGELNKKRVLPACAIQDSEIHKNEVDTLCESTKIIVDDHVFHEDMDKSRHSNKTLMESGQTEGLTVQNSVKVNMNTIQPESSNFRRVKDAVEVWDNSVVAQKDTGCPSSGCSINIDGNPIPYRKNDNRLSDPISAHPIAVGTDAIPSMKSDEPNMGNEMKKSKELDKMTKKAYEDSILRNACTIEASIKRAGERLPSNISLEKRSKSHWNFVLDEMAWMANDFMQERLWKSAAAAEMCHWIASDGQAKFEEAIIQRKQKMIMKSLAKGIMSFWCLAEASQTARRTAVMQEHNSTALEETKTSGIKADKKIGNTSLGAGESLQPRHSQIQDYAVRFLEYNCRTADSLVLAETLPTPDRPNDFGILKVSDQLSEENLFYTVPAGAMMLYRESVESLFEYRKRASNTELMDEYEASVCDSAADFPREDTYEEDEGETCTYLSPEAFEGGFMSTKCHKKKHQMHQRTIGARQYEIVPAKRSRTAARQRVVSPFHAGATRASHVISKTDASSGDTNSLQDDESSLHGGSLLRRNMDYESTVDFDRHLSYDACEVSTKANKKKKFNNLGYMTSQNIADSSAPASVKFRSHIYDQRVQVEGYVKKRPESHQYNLNGICAGNGVQHASKKLKMMKQGIHNSAEASRVVSQMSNMGNSARFVKIIGNRERERKCKALKMTSSDGWSSFEDQALVVLVHDMGQNWELVSDAINSIVQFKSVHRQPNECKERHKVLVDRRSDDGADSAEDSCSSQRYHNPLPGIPKGSARQLFERLQGPFDEENLKEHFEKIILMQQVHSRHRQGNSEELKPIMRPHNSHVVALSQTCVNKLPGGILTPFDLCDPTSPNMDSVTPGRLSLGSHTNGLMVPNHQGSSEPATPTSNLSSRLPGAPGMVLGNNLQSSSTWNTHRDTQKYGVPRVTSLQGDGQPKIQYSQVVSDRNFKHPGGSVPRVFPNGINYSGHAMPGAQMAGLNRGISASKAGSPRISAPGGLAVSSGNWVPNSGHPGGISGPGNSILRRRDSVQPGHSMEEHQQLPDIHMQVPQRSSHTTHVSCINPPLSNVAASPPVQYPQEPHQMSQSLHMFGNPHHSQIQETSASPQQRLYALHLPKERQTQQHMVPQQNSDISGASAVSRVHVQSGQHIVQQNQGSAVSPVPCSQPQHQRQQDPHNPRDASSSPNLPTSVTLQKQKKQQGQQQSRQNLQQRNQGSQQAKLLKSLGRGNMVIPQTQIPPVDNMPANAVLTNSKKNVPDKKQNGQGFPPANTAPTPCTLEPRNQPMFPQSLKQVPDIGNQSGMQGSSSQTLSDSQQPLNHSKSTLTTQQQQHFQMSSECGTGTHPKQFQHNQKVPATSVPLSRDSGSSLVSSVNQPKCEARNVASVTLSSNLLSSPSNTSFGNESVLLSSAEEVLQRRISSDFPTQVQWNIQVRQSQHQQAPIVQGSVYGPSNSGSG